MVTDEVWMRLTLCNEVVRDLPFERQCVLAKTLGYEGLEIAPFTLGEDAHRMLAAERLRLKRVAAEHGLQISGLHWLLVVPPGLSITAADEVSRARTIDVMRRLIELCHDLGGTYLVHGSPGQRMTGGDTAAMARGNAAFAAIADDAGKAGVIYCIEALAPTMTDYINTVAEAAAVVRQIGQPAVKTMIDACAAGLGESEPFAALIERWMPSGLIGHIHVNDRNQRGPGQGKDKFGPAMRALQRANYAGWIGVEPFEYVPDGPGSAAHAIGYLKGVMETAPR
jgi:D-psicose/D-tagatose/L-ribulose 3-epimerase